MRENNGRGQLLADSAKMFERGGVDKKRAKLEKENRKRTNSEANQNLLAEIQKLKGEHPAWGYRMKDANLLVPKRSKWTTNRGTDMTKVLIQGEGWVYVHVVIDWRSR